jgi:CHAT domain-containing protein/Tfp pilus assembly protein PilF
MVRPLGAMILAGLVWGGVLAGAAHAQEQDDLSALNREVARLHEAGRYSEAIPIAQSALKLASGRHGRDHPEVATWLNYLAGLYNAQGNYSEVEPLLERSLGIRETAFGSDHPSVANVLNNLAEFYRSQGRYSQAEPLYTRSHAITEKALGPSHPNVGTLLNNLALLYRAQGRYAEAEPLYRRSLNIRERALGPEHPSVATTLNNLAELHSAQGRYSDAESLLKRSLRIKEKAFGVDHPSVGTALNNLAELYRAQGHYSEAEPLYLRDIAISERTLGPEHPSLGTALGNLASLYRQQGRYAKAEQLYKRDLAITEKVLGPAHPSVAVALGNLAQLFRAQGRDAEAELLTKRTLVILEKALGPEHPDLAVTLNNLAEYYRKQGQHAEAEPLYRRSLNIRERALGPEHPAVAVTLNNLAELYGDLGRYAHAEALHQRSIAIREKALGPEHPDIAQSLNNLGGLFYAQGRYAEAEQLAKRSLSIWEKALGANHPSVGIALSNLADLHFAQGHWASAADNWRQSIELLVRQSNRSAADVGNALTGKAKSEAERESDRFLGLIKAAHRLIAGGTTRIKELASEMLPMAQWAQSSEAATSLAQMAARSAKGSPELATLVRERQDLVSEWQAKDKLLIAAKSEPPAKRKAEAEKVLAGRLTAIDARLAEINRRLAEEFPDYAALASPAPVSVAEIQAQLGPDEALVLFLDTPEWKPLPEETFIWVVTKSAVRWARSGLGTAALTREVTALRCGLDVTAWDGGGRERCTKVLAIPLKEAPGPNQPLPFDHARAHKLYLLLFGEVQALIKDKHLLIVPSGPLTQLPFQVLVTRPPTSSDHRAAAWLAREHAITVLPAVSSLKALRRVGKPSAAPRPLIGFGNPLLHGPSARYAGLAKKARDKQRCAEARGQRKLALVVPSASVAQMETRGGLADLSHLKAQVPLPETADELCDVAQNVKADVARDIRLGNQATELEVKRLSASGELAKYRMVHFATHGTLAGELKGTHEPGLILTPPKAASEEDDGYLSASEIAALKLDADWVVLSACNTAAGGATNAEALSGLGRAFIYAGARSLLVSHWAVYSDAAVKLITGAVGEMARDAKVGRAEAMRRSMLALIDRGSPEEAHPAYWAPFVVAGEGAAGK